MKSPQGSGQLLVQFSSALQLIMTGVYGLGLLEMALAAYYCID
jgi:hypothetical protein